MRRAVVTVALGASLAAVAWATPASAQEPITGVCSFPITVTELVNKEKAVVTLPSGVTITTGHLTVRIANADTGASVVLNVSGPIFTDASGNGTYRGKSLLFFGETGQLYWTSGTVVFGPSGVVGETGTRTNICDTLA
jgi:hypothetical protein